MAIEEEGGEGKSKIKLPIVQILEGPGNLRAEFICGNDIDSSVSKLQAYLTSLSRSSWSSGSSGYISNIYSESQLKEELSSAPSDSLTVLKIFRDGCKKCVKMEPLFYELSKEETFSSFRWLQVQAEYIPEYVADLKTRLSGVTASASGADSSATESGGNGKVDCAVCSNSGFVPCSECSGSGLVTRGVNTLFCAACGGKKKQRCPGCGGRCIACAD